MSDAGGPYHEAYLQLRQRTWELLLPHLERAVEETPGETYEIRTELANVRNTAYCRTAEGRGEAAPVDPDAWLKI